MEANFNDYHNFILNEVKKNQIDEIDEIECPQEVSKNMVIDDAIKYLKNHTFIPHKMGNYARYGLNDFGCDSIIEYNNQLWKFVWFLKDSNNAVYVNNEGREFILKDYNLDGIIRMQDKDE